MVEEANRGKLMVEEADRDKLGRRESGVRPSSEEQKSQLTVSYDYLASIVLYSKYVIISQCTVMHVV
jgi:hypothetical protein